MTYPKSRLLSRHLLAKLKCGVECGLRPRCHCSRSYAAGQLTRVQMSVSTSRLRMTRTSQVISYTSSLPDPSTSSATPLLHIDSVSPFTNALLTAHRSILDPVFMTGGVDCLIALVRMRYLQNHRFTSLLTETAAT